MSCDTGFSRIVLRLAPIIVVITVIIPAQSQPINRLDSLVQALSGPFATDSLQADVYRQIANYHIEFSPGDQALPWLDSLQDFSRKKKYKLGELFYHYGKAYFYFRRGGYDSIQTNLTKVLALAKEVNRPGWTADALNKLAIVSSILGNQAEAMQYLKEAIRVSRELADTDLLTMNLVALGNVQNEVGDYLEALQQFLTVDSLLSQSSVELHYRHGLALENVGIIYLEKFQNFQKALSYTREAKRYYFLENNDRGELDAADALLARIYAAMGQTDLADSLFQSAVLGFRSRGHERKFAETSMHYGELQIKIGNMRIAERLLKESENSYRKLADLAGLTNVSTILAGLFQTNGDFDQSIKYYRQSLQQPSSELQRSLILRDMATAHALAGDWRAAYDTLISYVQLNDSINKYELQSRLQEIESRYQTARKEREILDLQLTQSRQRLQTQKLVYFGGAGIFFLLLISFFFYQRARRRKRRHVELEKLDALKTKLFADISHEFRTPLSLIKGPVEMLMNGPVQPNIEKQLKIVARNSNRLNRLVDNVNSLGQLDAGKLKLQIRQVNLFEHLKVIAANFESLAQIKGLGFSTVLEIPDRLYCYDPKHLETMIYNLLSNAFKFTEIGEVQLKAIVEDSFALLTVSDTGPGLGVSDQEKIFDRYFRVEGGQQQTEGIGIGLALAYELSRLHFGNLSLHSELGKGSDFILKIPVQEGFFSTRNIPVGQEYVFISQKIDTTIADRSSIVPSVLQDEPILLLVEDNPDMQAHLNTLFRDEYRIISASNGRQGLELALRYVPDLIVSDLMMPVMDGQEFLKALREDPKTSHIPFIMLTANQMETVKLQGLQHGADDFMTKPFSIDEIKVKVQNFIQMREMLRSKYQQDSLIDPEVLATNDTDRQFWRQLQEVVRTHLNDPEFSTEDFAEAMATSRMQLHRKMKALTGLSTSAFFRTQRIKAAAQMLREGHGNVSEVAYSVGFTSPFYFSKCFKESYGISPSQYATNPI